MNKKPKNQKKGNNKIKKLKIKKETKQQKIQKRKGAWKGVKTPKKDTKINIKIKVLKSNN